ncbi:uncharacterized protein E0L32_003755 [Thyridium curvatum]|uniref:Uncharacterized protein n=1 Tax=Thyridium curvatum TaxID=1093900 RepID=A0A507BHJ0_9PEZI|nr:uncharacterized protein E0L32_003755 [Thyridium curvatum]TPX16461.1 hypothetical protein E0L32_003755 [Thyridium curvatum]
MSQTAAPSNDGLSEFHFNPSSSSNSFTQDSPTIGRTQAQHPPAYSTPSATRKSSGHHTPLTGSSQRSQRRPTPSPLHTTTAVSPSSSNGSPSSASNSSPAQNSPASIPQIVTTSHEERKLAATQSSQLETTYYDSDSSAPSTPVEKNTRLVLSPSHRDYCQWSILPNLSCCSAAYPSRLPNDSSRSVSDPVVTSRPLGASTLASSQKNMPGPAASRVEGSGPMRNSSIDSAISALSSSSHSHKNSQDGQSQKPVDVASLIKAAGSAEAVIQYLLKEKQSQSQQNAQLWRLVDKQRAMILGLNKDLERALKDKEKYRKKLKEFVAAQDVPPLPAPVVAPAAAAARPAGEPAAPREQVLEVPISPIIGSDGQKHSPIDMALAPYPITPPADQMAGPASAVGQMLDPSHAMPKPQEHALDQYDHEAQDREAEAARKAADASKDLPLSITLPSSRSLPGNPPQMPPPSLPPAPSHQAAAPSPTTSINEGLAQFPPPPAPPPRKPPPAPLQLRTEARSPTIPPDEGVESESDYDDLLEVEEITMTEKRGRRRTREEDDRMREVLAMEEAEARSLSKKSKKSASAKGTPKSAVPAPEPAETDPSVRLAPPPVLQRSNIPASLASVLSGGDLGYGGLSLLSPGLPASPRPPGLPSSPMQSPPLSPRGVGGIPPAPLSPRPPRQPIPLPPNTPLQTPSPANAAEPPILTSPKPLNIVKKVIEVGDAPSLSDGGSSRDSPIGRTKVYKGLVTEEYPDLLLPPNALPSIDIKVASSRMKPSRASLLSFTQLEEDPVFTLAIFSRADGGELWRVEKDSASLAKLDQRLKQCPAFTAKTPDRSLFSGHAPAKLDARRLALDYYLDELLNTPLDQATALELCRYLSHNTLPPYADETGGSAEQASSSSEPSTTSVGPGGRPFKNGYLTKRGKNFGGWKARFFVLDGPQLKYYETPGGAHLGTIKLQNAQIGKQAQAQQNDNSSPARGAGTDDSDNQYRHAFLILEPKKKDPSAMTKHVLCAESDRERDQWVDTLLRWIDYRDPDDEDAARKDHDRQGSAASERAPASSKKKHSSSKKPQQQQQQQQQQATSSDTLISVSYDAAQQGDAPQGVPTRQQRGGQAPHDDDQGRNMAPQPSYAISAPRDPQVIPDSASWGSRVGGLAAPSTDEKKVRKRSFFGFGPKARSSSDGQDSLFGDSNGGLSSTPPQGGVVVGGPVRQVFGAPLAEAVRYNSPVDVSVPLPAVVYRCIQYLDAKNAISEEGIFRLSGSNVVIKQLRERFNNNSDIDLLADETYYDIHAVASLLKLYLRELPTTILTRDLHMEFLSVTEMTGQREKLAALNELAQRLPLPNATLLKYLISFLIKIINNSDKNKMTVRNVGIVFSPTLNIPAPVFAMFLQNYEAIFGIEPEQYELPSPTSDKDSYGRPSVDPLPRPPTSQASESPHRQRLMDAVKSGQRSSPTPPPALVAGVSHYNQPRPAQQTPPPQRQLSYEPQYLAQQNAAGSHISLRPAYESGFVVPPGYDPTQAPPQHVQQPLVGMVAPRANPGYDRPIYEGGGGGGYDNAYAPSAKASRRESGLFMGNGVGGLSQQGSRSRLREESHY